MPTPTPTFTDDQMDTVRAFAAPLHRTQRSAFVARVADLLRGREVGPGALHRACALVQREMFIAPADTVRRVARHDRKIAGSPAR